jgi:prepilin-type N-terminal cleavage/methylation domain-containing protein
MKQRAFTLIELLVVIAIIAILMAITLPALTTANDRSNIARCRTNLQQIHLACKMYADDCGAFPPSLDALYQARYLDDPETLVCSKTGQRYDYHPASLEAPRETWLATCVPANTPVGKRPHTHGEALVGLRVGGQVAMVQ